MPRSGLTTLRVVRTAGGLVDRHGAERLTLAAVAAELGVKSPSLYNHVDGLDGLLGLVAADAVRSLGETCRRAAVGRAGGDALRAMARAFRAWGREHPGLYPLTQRARPHDAAWSEASDDLLEVVFAVLAGYELRGEAAVHAARLLRAALHGFLLLEVDGGFGMAVDVNESFEHMLRVLDDGLRAGVR